MNDLDVSVQWVTQFDDEACAAIVSLVDFAVNDGGTLGYSRPLAHEEAVGFVAGLKRRVDIGEAHVLLGRASGLPAVLAVLSLNGMHNCRHRAEIGKGIVHPAFRGQRLVELALKQLVKRAESLEVDQLVLDVREGSRAHALWVRFGFCGYGVLDDYARIDGKTHRGHYMVQPVASLRARLGMDRQRTRIDETEVLHA
jgi:ribosomal protein S18 acetylase RimI-like enzyme